MAVNIKRIDVPDLVEVGTESVVLDCDYGAGADTPGLGLVVKWFFNGSSGLVYQWIPPMQPQVIGLLKGKVDLTFRISGMLLISGKALFRSRCGPRFHPGLHLPSESPVENARFGLPEINKQSGQNLKHCVFF